MSDNAVVTGASLIWLGGVTYLGMGAGLATGALSDQAAERTFAAGVTMQVLGLLVGAGGLATRG